MAAKGQIVFGVAAVFLTLAVLTNGEYLITTPRIWASGSNSQICVTLTAPASANDILSLELGLIPPLHKYRVTNEGIKTILKKDFVITADGKSTQCESVKVPVFKATEQIQFKFYGTLNGEDFVQAHNGSIIGEENTGKTFVQTDKYLYKPGQEVNMRLLTVHGPFMKISYEPYDIVYVESPSGTRIAQWRNVSNTEGLVHLKLQLADEPDYGSYTVKAKNPKSFETSKSFRVDEYVLPRFEVTMTPPPYITTADDKFNMTVCAKYTYGESVQGLVNITVSNNQWGSCDNSLNYQVPISGCTQVEFSGRQLYFQTPSCYLYRISARAFVIENGTDVKIQADRVNMRVHDRVLNFENVDPPKNIKPLIPQELRVKATYPDDSPAERMPFEVCWNLPRKGHCKNITSYSTGEIVFTLPVYSTYSVRSLIHGVVRNNFSDDDILLYASMFHQYYIQSYYSPTNSTLQIKRNPKINCLYDGTADINLEVMFTSHNQTSAEVFVQIISRGMIQHTSSQTVSLKQSSFNVDEANLVEPIKAPRPNMTTGAFSFPISLTSTDSPSPEVLLWYAKDNGEVVLDSIKLDIEECLNHKVTMGWSNSKVQPGEKSTLQLWAEPDAICSVGVVDKSVDLLAKTNNPLTVSSVFGVSKLFNINSWQHSQIDEYAYCTALWEKENNATLVTTTPSSKPRPVPLNDGSKRKKRSTIIRRPSRPFLHTEDADAFTLMNDAGIFAFSNLKLENRPCIEDGFYHTILEDNSPAPQAFAGSSASFGSAGAGGVSNFATQANKGGVESTDSSRKSESDDVRTYFPETWLWDLKIVGKEGKLFQNLSLPDTITEWVGHSVCVHQDKGVGLSSKVSIKTFTPFFIDLTLPAIVTRGEIIPVKISVFNYLESDFPVKMTLHTSSEYDLLKDNSTTESFTEHVEHTACISGGTKEVFTVRLRPTALGDVNITVSADILNSIGETCPNVENVEKSDAVIKPVKVEAEGFPRERTWSKFFCSRDEVKTEDWDFNIPLVTVEGSDRAWINVIGDMMGPTLDNLENLVQLPYGCGEQNMIRFAPNVFVLRYLEHTNQTTEEIIYRIKHYIRNGYQRQLRYRHSNGAYSLFGQSDYSGSTWLTAFVVKSFAQAINDTHIDKKSLKESVDWLHKQQGDDGCFDPVGTVLHKGMKGGLKQGRGNFLHTSYVLISLLESYLYENRTMTDLGLKCIKADDTQNFYGQSLKAYALALADDPEASVVLDSMVEKAEVLTNSIYWSLKDIGDNSDAVEVETAGYVVLAMMRVDPNKYKDVAWKIIRWMSTKRNAQGGFVSTQDTVVALQAMASFEMHLPKNPLDLVIGINVDNVPKQVKVNDANKLLQQRTVIPDLPANVTIDVDSTGCALVQGVLRYNAPDPDPSRSFSVSVETDTALDQSCKMKVIEACASYVNVNDPESNMAILEVNLISGYTPIKADLKRETRYKFKRYEVDGRKVTFYADKITKDKLCANFRVQREINIENPQPGIVKVYDYYEPDLHVSTSYELESPDHCNYELDLPNSKGLQVTNTCFRRRWQRPSANANSESTSTPVEVPLTTWCVPRGTFPPSKLGLLN